MQFVMAVTDRWPDVVLQFEDFNLEHAEPLLQVCSFTDSMHSVWGWEWKAMLGLHGIESFNITSVDILCTSKHISCLWI